MLRICRLGSVSHKGIKAGIKVLTDVGVNVTKKVKSWFVKKEMNPISNFKVDFSEKEMSIFDELESMLNKEQKQ